jgi:hypothetical protein
MNKRLITIIERYKGKHMPLTHRDDVYLAENTLYDTLDDIILPCSKCGLWCTPEALSEENGDEELCEDCYNEKN